MITFKEAEEMVGDPSFRQALAKTFKVTILEVTKWQKENKLPEKIQSKIFSLMDDIKETSKKITHEKRIMRDFLKNRNLPKIK